MPVDYSKYPPNWKTEIVPAILARAGDRCEFCGLKNGSYVWSFKVDLQENSTGKKYTTTLWSLDKRQYNMFKSARGLKRVKVILTVAHLDHDPENWEVTVDRLKALCQRCHFQYDREHKK